MRRTSASTATSPVTAMAWPPAAVTDCAVSRPAFSSMSAMTTRAPSSANRNAAARPMPIPAPVMKATLPSRRPGMPSDPFRVAHELPVRDGAIERLLLEPGGVQVVLDDGIAEGGARDVRPLQLPDGLAQRLP